MFTSFNIKLEYIFVVVIGYIHLSPRVSHLIRYCLLLDMSRNVSYFSKFVFTFDWQCTGKLRPETH